MMLVSVVTRKMKWAKTESASAASSRHNDRGAEYSFDSRRLLVRVQFTRLIDYSSTRIRRVQLLLVTVRLLVRMWALLLTP